MIRTYHVLSPFNRFENLRSLIDMLAGQRSPRFELRWHPIFDEDLPFAIHFPQSWITPGYCPPSRPFWSMWADALNRYISSGPLHPEHRYCILNDDDAYEPEFFEKVDKVPGDILIVGMKRGHHIPAGVIPERAHGTETLEARPEAMAVGHVGAEQMICSGRVFERYGFNNSIAADGERIVKIITEEKIVSYVPEASVWFNYYEPGRWDK